MSKGSKVYSIRMSGDEQIAFENAVAAAGVSQTDFLRLAVLKAVMGEEVLGQVRHIHEEAIQQMDAMRERTLRVLATMEMRQVNLLDERVRQLTEIAIEAGAQMSTPPPRSG